MRVGGGIALPAGGPLTAPTTPDKRVAVVDRRAVDPELVRAAEGMEAMFINYLMQTMRQSVPKSELSGDSGATAVYQGMMDAETAQAAARGRGVGLADQIIAYVEAQRYAGKTAMKAE